MGVDEAIRSHDIADEERQRANLYALLGRLLVAPPSEAELSVLRGLRGDGSELGRALYALAALATRTSVERLRDEYHDLFIGLAQGEVIPFASVYLTGFLQERPLADLRGDMIRLQVRRRDDVFEPEDHIGSICEMMAGLITGAFGAPLSIAEQRRFFERHLLPWAPRFFGDLERAKSATFYMPVGTIGRVFMEIEQDAFSMS